MLTSNWNHVSSIHPAHFKMAAHACRTRSCRFWRALLPITRSVHNFYPQCSNSFALRNYSLFSLSCTKKSNLFCSRIWSNSLYIPSQNYSILLSTSLRRTGTVSYSLVGPRRLYSTGYRHDHNSSSGLGSANRRSVIYMVAIAVGVLGLTYAAVPLYKIFCQVPSNDLTALCTLCN